MVGQGRRTALLVAAVMCLGAVMATVPAGADTTAAAGERQSRGSIEIRGDGEFNPANGVRSGSGTRSDPFVISNWDVSQVRISDTSKYLVIRDNTIGSRLVLNWNGDRVKVVKNDISDLRVNENVKRTGGPTSGLIANNRIGIVGQLRHFDGIFEKNVVGEEMNYWDKVPFFDERAVNFDGFNGARFRNNTIYGYMDVRLHGHHHSSGFKKNSHNHAMPREKDDEGSHEGHGYEKVDHSQRYHQVWVTGNKIFAPGSRYALAYTDTNHAANDRTANSEPNKALEAPHVHYTKVHLNNNELVGSGLLVDVFNALDKKYHKKWAYGAVEIGGNKITLGPGEIEDTFSQRDGITVWSARSFHLNIRNNEIGTDYEGDVTRQVEAFRSGEAGIRLENIDEGRLHLMGNSVSGTFYGIYARDMTERVWWHIHGLETAGVQEPVWYDNSVKNRPGQGP
jgi:hypothetical protein